MAKQCKLRMSIICLLMFVGSSRTAIGEGNAIDWITNEFQPSTLTKAQQQQELQWFIDAAKPYQHLTIRVTSERIATHIYESEVLAKSLGLKLSMKLLAKMMYCIKCRFKIVPNKIYMTHTLVIVI
ncbi:hypothetical protein AB4298_16670 [Shewanella sp. 10N.261.52.F9]|uniref:hypothetical protein n=1 Tax=Shewanella sp. 10N.261.52.F9 TaxID=3229684 RepID=UPI003552B16C